ncbi:hypothetical protein NQ315_012561 [Exocentrus adspersus]|uniref:Transposable element P transposase-like RNase H domain-containing protein n=1 Tax=Exocentrus adspersus TaxID=1586481 RepID=A0AAV8VDA9_9CUCU|nr:hypothetical protein NQ315_012561 [Exocentrus adspersus]
MPFDKLYQNCVVCATHFLPEQLQFGGRRGLKPNAVPVLFLNKDQQILSSEMFVEQHEDNNIPVLSTVPKEIVVEISELSAIPKEVEDAVESTVITPSTSGINVECVNTEVNTKLGSKKSGILKEVSVTRQKYLSPNARHFYQRSVASIKKLARMGQRLKSFKQRYRAAQKVSEHCKSIMSCVNSTTYNFILSQVRTQKQKPKARRFTVEDKILALSLFKASGKGYKLLAKIFSLPSKKTLTNLLGKIPFHPGINKNIFETLKKSVHKMKEYDRTAILIFDEMYISSLVHYSVKEDILIGLHDEGIIRKPVLADYVNVFMLKGVFRQWKQPICFTLSGGPTKSKSLKTMIKNVIQESQNIGLNIIATVCDQGGPNQAAINDLLQETNLHCLQHNVENRYQGFLVNGVEIIPLFDSPHLLKGLRNNLLTKDLYFHLNEKNCVAKWKHIEQFYLLDVQLPDRICHKLTDQHVIPEKNQQNESQMLYPKSKIHKYNWIPVQIDTANLILFLDKLFDSLNSSRKTGPPGKPLKGGVQNDSVHIQFWYDAIKILESMKFYCTENSRFVKVPSILNLIRTLKGFIYLSKKLCSQHKTKFVLLRVFQQDALENLFGCIRNYSGQESNPGAAHFITLLVNNFMSTHSPNSNCQEDYHTGALDNLRSFITGEVLPGVTPLPDDEEPEVPSTVTLHRRSKVSRCTATYISGFIARKLLRKTKCENCKSNLLFRDNNNDTDFIKARQYDHCKLIKPGTVFTFLVSQSIARLFYLIPKLCHLRNISSILEKIISSQLNFKVINCALHDPDKILVKLTVRYSLYFWCKRVNLVAKGKDDKFIKFLDTKPHTSLIDPVKLSAYKKYQSRVKRAKRNKRSA